MKWIKITQYITATSKQALFPWTNQLSLVDIYKAGHALYNNSYLADK